MKSLIRLAPGAIQPAKAYPDDAGYDLFTNDTTPLTNKVGVQFKIATGVYVALPAGVYIGILPRSSTLEKYGVHVVPAVIDNGYRGELFIQCLIASNSRLFEQIPKGYRIAQMVPHFIVSLEFESVPELPTSPRGTQGFGSSGH